MEKNIYLAGPDVFLQNAFAIAAEKKNICRRFGFRGLFPLDQDETVEANAGNIFAANCKLMQSADMGVFNLTPFRGPSADCGTAFELGFMFALGKPVHAYIGTELNYIERVVMSDGPFKNHGEYVIDRSGFLVENFDRFDNLMLSESIAKAGGLVVADNDGNQNDLSAMKAFQACMEAIAESS